MPGLRVDERVGDIHERGDVRLRARVRKTRPFRGVLSALRPTI